MVLLLSTLYMSDLLKIFSQNLKSIRKEKGFYTQNALATAAGINIGVVKNAESMRGLPEYKNIEAIAKALGVDEYELFRVSREVTVEELQEAMFQAKDRWESERKEPAYQNGVVKSLSDAIQRQADEILDLKKKLESSSLPADPLVKDRPVVVGGKDNSDRDWFISLANTAPAADLGNFRRNIEAVYRLRGDKAKNRGKAG